MKALKIVVTGASGFIGYSVARTLAESLPGSTVIGVGKSKESSVESSFVNYEYVSCDLLKDQIYKKLPSEIDIIIHLAGDRRTFVKSGEYSGQVLSNIVMTSYMADYAHLSKAKLFMYSSSVYVYSGNKETPFLEDQVEIPGENLGATKLAAESLLKTRAVSGQFKAVAFRIGTVYGPGSSREQFISQAIRKLNSSDRIVKFGNGDIKRDFICKDDVAQAFRKGLALYDKDIIFEALNVGSGVKTSICEVVKILGDIIGKKKLIEFNAVNKVAHKADTDHQLDITKIRAVLGWSPETEIKDGLRQTVESFTQRQ